MDLRDFFGGIRIGDALGSEKLQAFPLILPRDDELTCALLDELPEQGLAEITEVNAGGSVPELAVENRSDPARRTPTGWRCGTRWMTTCTCPAPDRTPTRSTMRSRARRST